MEKRLTVIFPNDVYEFTDDEINSTIWKSFNKSIKVKIEDTYTLSNKLKGEEAVLSGKDMTYTGYITGVRDNNQENYVIIKVENKKERKCVMSSA